LVSTVEKLTMSGRRQGKEATSIKLEWGKVIYLSTLRIQTGKEEKSHFLAEGKEEKRKEGQTVFGRDFPQ